MSALVFLGASVLLLARRSRSWLILFLATTLILAGVNYTDAFFAFYVRQWPVSALSALVGFTSALSEICQLAAFLIFPDGRFVPRWLRWLLVAWIPHRLLAWMVFYPMLSGDTVPLLIDISLQMVYFGIGIVGQLYRYQQAETPMHRQQTKWIIFGLSMAVPTLVLYEGIGIAVPALLVPGTAGLIYVVAGTIIHRIALLLIPLSVTVSILRYRLWDIDFFINRSLVYGGLMILLGLVVVGVFASTQALLGVMVDMHAGAAGIVSLVVAITLFLPVRDRLQRFVDSRLYGVDPDYERAIQAAIAQERERLSRELHDSVTQSLYGLTIMAESCQRLVRDESKDLKEPLAEMGNVARQALKEMRLLIHQLRPPVLEEEGLLSALHQRLAAVEKRSGIEASLIIDEIIDLPVVMEEALYHIAVEALNNAIKHAQATSVSLCLRKAETWVELIITDDGKGFEPGPNGKPGGMGLTSMHKRAEGLGGTLTVQSAPGQGTKVTARLSYHMDPRRRRSKVVL
jgi:signal transduction histidine kinase